MSMFVISSVHNEKVQLWRALSKKAMMTAGECRFIAEGEHMTQEALQYGFAVAVIVHEEQTEKYAVLLNTAREKEVPVFQLSEKAYAAICDTKTPQGISAECLAPTGEADAARGRSVLLERVQDPGNVGTILRTVDAAGFDCLIVDKETANPYSPKALRASMGAIFHVPVIISEDIYALMQRLRTEHTDILAGDLQGGDFFNAGYDAQHVCILVGNEGSGISDGARQCANMRVRIPMPGKAESLNAGVAASIMIYDAVRRNV